MKEAGSEEEQNLDSNSNKQSTSPISNLEMISWKHNKSQLNQSDLPERDTQSLGKKIRRFSPEKLFSMITEQSKTDPTTMSWRFNIEVFFILEKSPRLSSTLHEYFDHGRYSSLQNMYGFKKSTNGKYEGTFSHPLFHRDISCHS